MDIYGYQLINTVSSKDLYVTIKTLKIIDPSNNVISIIKNVLKTRKKTNGLNPYKI